VASGLLKAGVDLDTLLMARVNAKRADVGLKVGGVDISNRFETIGAGTPIAATGFKSAGTDLANLFRSISEPLGTTYAFQPTYFDTGFSSTFIGYSGYWGVGALSPGAFKGQTIMEFMDLLTNVLGDPPTFVVTISGNPPVNFFTSVVVNGRTFLSAAATFTAGSDALWRWSTTAALVSGTNYAPVIS
jgi:hypothetical protein